MEQILLYAAGKSICSGQEAVIVHPSVAQTRNAEVSRVLTQAVSRIADLWQLPNVKLGTILGLSGPTASHLRGGRYQLEPGSKPF